MTKSFTVEQLRCLELARIIREGLPGVKFKMCHWGHCGTAGCIAGHAVFVYAPEKRRGDVRAVARALLGVTEEQTGELFCALNTPVSLGDITPAMAAATLENYALTGKVEWPKP